MTRKGRKRASAPRHPGGKLVQRTPQEREDRIMSVALGARERVFGLSPEMAKAMPESSPLGRLRAMGEISMRQYEAGARFQSIARDYDKALLAKGLPAPGDLNRSRAYDGDDGTGADYAAWCRRAVERYDACNRALQEADRVSRGASMATKLIAVVGFDKPELVGLLRVGLNSLAHVLRLPPVEAEGKQGAAA